MKTKLFYFTLFVFCSFGLLAQTGGSMKASLTGKAAYMREIPAFSKMENIISASEKNQDGQAKRRGKNTYIPGKGFPRNGDPLVKLQKNNAAKMALKAPLVSFDAHEGTSTPTDPTGAIGPNHYVYAFNTGFGIRDRSGNVLLAEASLATLFPGESLGDPIVVYDNFADRFIIMQFSNSPNGFLIAIGQGPDPVNDGWFTYRFNTNEFPDYEKLSIWSDGYYISANKAPDGPIGSLEVFYAVERDKMLVGDASAGLIGFQLPGAQSSGFYSPAGFNATGSTLPPVGTGTSIVYLQDDAWSGVSTDHLKVWTTNVDWVTPANSTISQPQEIPTAPFDSVFDNGSFNNLDEPGTGPDIDALQATMMYMTNYRRFGTHNSVVMNFVVDLDGNDSLAGIRWYELRQTGDGAPWTIFQEGTYAQPDGHSAFSGSIAQDALGNIALGYTVVSSSVFTSIRYTGRLAGDPVGTMTAAEEIAIDGDRRTPGGSGRYGDYSQMTIDPLDDMTFWHIGEYMRGASNTRKNHVVAFKIAPDIPDTEAPSTPTNLTASAITESSATLSWDVSTDNIGVAGYDVYQDGAVIGTVAGATIDVSGLTASTSYDFFVIAKDAAGNESVASATLAVTTLAPDTQAPSVPANLVELNVASNQVTIGWDASTDNVGVTEYDVLQDGVVVATVAETTAVITGLTAQTIYEFTVVAKDAAGNESATSSPLSITTTEATGCINGVAVPYNESFETGFGDWTQQAGDDLDWTRDSNGTPSNNTGPSSADDGSTYIYVEASGNGTGFPNKRAILNSPCFDLNGATSAVFSFRYHMFGSNNFGTLDVEASNDEGVTWTSIWTRSGNQGNSWQTATIDLAAYVGAGLQLRFNRVTGGTWQADAAIDAISLTTDSGPGGNCATGDLTLSITFDNYPQETSWTLTNSGGTVVASESYSTANPDGSTVNETISGLASGSYTFTISDSFGDGICCGFGNGSYTLSSSAGTIASGGEFTSSDATEFCVQGTSLRLDTYELTDATGNDKRFILSPNPVSSILNISVDKTPIQNLEIFSMYGQRVHSVSNQGTNKKMDMSKIDVSNFPVGTYFVRIIAEEVIVTRSFIKQ